MTDAEAFGRQPTIETDRLFLRPLDWDDLDALAALHAEASFWWYPLRRSQSRQETEAFIARTLRWYRSDGFGLSAAVVKDTDELAGFIGLSIPRFLPQILPCVEVGWRLGERHRGQGLATEGGAAALGYGFQVLGLARVVSIFEPANQASARVMDKLGLAFELETVDPVRGDRLQVRSLTRQRWQELRSLETCRLTGRPGPRPGRR